MDTNGPVHTKEMSTHRRDDERTKRKKRTSKRHASYSQRVRHSCTTLKQSSSTNSGRGSPA